MEPVAAVVDKLKGFAKSSEEFVKGVIYNRENSARRNPNAKAEEIGSNKLYDGALQLFPLYDFQIEILKRLQREAFSDLMKLRDRQDKVERMIFSFKSLKGSPFQEASTHIRGEVNVTGALLLVDNIDQQNCDTLSRAGIRTGIDSRFTFETTIRQKDTLVAEFVASQNGQGYLGDVSGSPLSLAKVTYLANVSDWFSAVAIPVGAQCKDVGISQNSSQQGRGLTNISSFWPPILNQCHGGAVGLMVRRSNVAASLAEFVTGLRAQPGSVGIRHCFSTFGQVICQLSKGTKLTILGLHQMSKTSSQQISLSVLTIPVGILKRNRSPDTSIESSSPPIIRNTEENISVGSIALMLESELDESTRLGGWIEMHKSNPKHLQWAVTMSDSPEDEVGWGLSLGGIIQGPSNWDHFQVEAFLKFNMGKRFSLQPGLVYVMDGTTRIPALMFRSSWSM
ncbi:hypothetical protein HHK36_031183 [Tetracentron sinense]|uniref:Uncharacterized protein n=1 Tax=Tetracentron sinense TaxID=13715 RepID=A0A834Y8Z2_TETSI|nr:hypothetical protein HHK36_031183 [Tetracentron sinense]